MRRSIAAGVTPCPDCGQIGLQLETRFQVKEPPSASLRKAAPELTGKFLPHLSCKADCGWEAWGRTETGYVVFSFDEGETDDE